jgi:hypothetical protein
LGNLEERGSMGNVDIDIRILKWMKEMCMWFGSSRFRIRSVGGLL